MPGTKGSGLKFLTVLQLLISKDDKIAISLINNLPKIVERLKRYF